MFHKFDIRYKYDITFYQIKKAEMTRGRVDSGAEMETGRADPCGNTFLSSLAIF